MPVACREPFIMRHGYTRYVNRQIRRAPLWEIKSEIGRKEQLGSVNGNVGQV